MGLTVSFGVQVLGYITETLGLQHDEEINNLEDRVSQFLQLARPYKLTKAELLQIVNLLPSSEVELYSVH